MSNANFWKKTDRSGDCWIWTGARNLRGYGVHSIARRQHLAHRLSYQFSKGPIPSGMGVLHQCDTPACINPAHLFLGDQAANMADCAAKERTTSTINAQIVRSIVRARLNGESTYRIAANHGIDQTTVSLIITGKHWKHLVEPHLPALRKVKCVRADAKVTPAIAADIRKRLAQGEMGKDIAVLYGISRARVSEINTGKAWR